MLKNTMFVLIISFALVFAIWPSSTLAKQGSGAAGGEFLEIPVGARNVALAGATTALPGDLSALFRNPALLATDRHYRLNLNHQSWFQGLNEESAILAFALPQGWGATAFHVRYLHMDPIPAFDSSLEQVGEFQVYDLAAGVSWANRFHRRVDLGFNFSGIRQKLADTSGSGWSLDLGTGLVAAGYYWSASLRNISGGIQFEEDRYDLDRELSLGVARFFPSLGTIATFEYRHPDIWGASMRGGVEYTLAQKLSLRAGYSYSLEETVESPGQPSFGLGVNLGSLGLDYAYQSHEHLGDTHAVTVNLLGTSRYISPYRYFRPTI